MAAIMKELVPGGNAFTQEIERVFNQQLVAGFSNTEAIDQAESALELFRNGLVTADSELYEEQWRRQTTTYVSVLERLFNSTSFSEDDALKKSFLGLKVCEARFDFGVDSANRESELGVWTVGLSQEMNKSKPDIAAAVASQVGKYDFDAAQTAFLYRGALDTVTDSPGLSALLMEPYAGALMEAGLFNESVAKELGETVGRVSSVEEVDATLQRLEITGAMAVTAYEGAASVRDDVRTKQRLQLSGCRIRVAENPKDVAALKALGKYTLEFSHRPGLTNFGIANDFDAECKKLGFNAFQMAHLYRGALDAVPNNPGLTVLLMEPYVGALQRQKLFDVAASKELGKAHGRTRLTLAADGSIQEIEDLIKRLGLNEKLAVAVYEGAADVSSPGSFIQWDCQLAIKRLKVRQNPQDVKALNALGEYAVSSMRLEGRQPQEKVHAIEIEIARLGLNVNQGAEVYKGALGVVAPHSPLERCLSVSYNRALLVSTPSDAAVAAEYGRSMVNGTYSSDSHREIVNKLDAAANELRLAGPARSAFYKGAIEAADSREMKSLSDALQLSYHSALLKADPASIDAARFLGGHNVKSLRLQGGSTDNSITEALARVVQDLRLAHIPAAAFYEGARDGVPSGALSSHLRACLDISRSRLLLQSNPTSADAVADFGRCTEALARVSQLKKGALVEACVQGAFTAFTVCQRDKTVAGSFFDGLSNDVLRQDARQLFESRLRKMPGLR